MQFFDVLTRQAHPGPGVEAYDSLDRKLADGERHRKEYGLPWPVLVDDVPGKVHQVYGTLADPAYLIDSAGNVSYYDLWTNAPELHRAIARLMEQGGRGVADPGIGRKPALLPVFVNGWPAIRRGLPQSYIDLETALPGSATVLWLGQYARPWLSARASRIAGLEEAAVEKAPALGARQWAIAAGAFAGAVAGLLLYRRVRTA